MSFQKVQWLGGVEVRSMPMAGADTLRQMRDSAFSQSWTEGIPRSSSSRGSGGNSHLSSFIREAGTACVRESGAAALAIAERKEKNREMEASFNRWEHTSSCDQSCTLQISFPPDLAVSPHPLPLPLQTPHSPSSLNPSILVCVHAHSFPSDPVDWRASLRLIDRPMERRRQLP